MIYTMRIPGEHHQEGSHLSGYYFQHALWIFSQVQEGKRCCWDMMLVEQCTVLGYSDGRFLVVSHIPLTFTDAVSSMFMA